jgi:polysaccharide biosynthesis transport protein
MDDLKTEGVRSRLKSTIEDNMETDDERTIQDFIAILKRRKLSLILPALMVFVIAAIVALALPPVYRSTATILIEGQELPQEYATSMVTSFAEQRIQRYNQRIMSSTKLIEIMNRYNLYSDLRAKRTIEEVIEKMRKDIKLQTITPEVVDQTGRRTSATIAFAVSYEGNNPDAVQQVTNILASLYLEENLKMREEKTESASKFIEDELNQVQTSLANQDAKIAAFKQRNINSLPELSQMNVQEIDRAEQTIERLEISLREGKDREGLLQTQLASVSPDLTNPDKERLSQLRVNLIALTSRYSDIHPDVIKAKAEIAQLEKKLQISADKPMVSKPDNPAYVTLVSQLSSTRAEIEAIKQGIAAVGRKKDEYQARIHSFPRVEEGYKALIGERNSLQLKYDDLMKKHMETKVASGLEKGQMGERFTLIDPARLPEKPIRPNIPAILLIGLFLGIGAGVGTVSLKEYADQAVRSAEAVTRATGFAVLASIPEILTFQDIARTKRHRVTAVISAAVVVVGCVVVFHFFFMDLDVFWAKVMRRFMRL